jgi:hypothetical protein
MFLQIVRSKLVSSSLLFGALAFLSHVAYAQAPTITSVQTSNNLLVPNQAVTLTATIQSQQVQFSTPSGAGVSSGGFVYYRFDLVGTRFLTAPVAANFVNVTTPTNFGSVVVAQGGGALTPYIVYQVSAGTGGIQSTDTVRLSFTPETVTSTSSVNMTVHDRAFSAFGDVPANTSVVFSAPTTRIAGLPGPATITGTVTFKNGATNIAGCVAAPFFSTATAICNTSFPTAGTASISAVYSGDLNYAASSGTLQGGQVITLDISPVTQPSGIVGTVYDATIVGVGGVAPYSFRLDSGDLPPGLSLATSGRVTGTPTTAGGFDFSVVVTDANGTSTSRKTGIAISRGEQTLLFAPPTSAIVGTSLPVPTTTSAGLSVSYFVDSLEVCTASGASIRFLSPGACVVTPSQAGDSNFLPLASSARTVLVYVAGGIQPLRVRAANGQASTYSFSPANLFTSATGADPGADFRILALTDIDGNKTPEIVFQNINQGDLGDVRVWQDGSAAADRLLRGVRLTWHVEATGDLDGDGFGDLVWRFTGQSPNADDTGVSYVWFTNGVGIAQIRKRGGAPLSWKLVGAADVNADGAADMVYIGPTNEIRVLMATPARTCANLGAGVVPNDAAVLKFGAFTQAGRAELLMRNTTTGEVSVVYLDGRGLVLPAATANPDDPNAACTSSNLTVISTRTTLGAVASSFQFFGTADFNGDGLLDIVWINTDRQTIVWQSQGAGKPYTVVETAGVIPAGFSPLSP